MLATTPYGRSIHHLFSLTLSNTIAPKGCRDTVPDDKSQALGVRTTSEERSRDIRCRVLRKNRRYPSGEASRSAGIPRTKIERAFQHNCSAAIVGRESSILKRLGSTGLQNSKGCADVLCVSELHSTYRLKTPNDLVPSHYVNMMKHVHKTSSDMKTSFVLPVGNGLHMNSVVVSRPNPT